MRVAETYFGQRDGAHGDSTRIQPDERLRQGEQRLRFREGVLAFTRWRSARDRKIYAMSMAGLSSREIARKTGLNRGTVQEHIHRAERAGWAEVRPPVSLLPIEVRIWRAWLRGEWVERIRKRRAPSCTAEQIEAVIDRCKRHVRRQAQPSPKALARKCPRTFVRRLGDMTPDAVLEAAQRDPELAELVAHILTG